LLVTLAATRQWLNQVVLALTMVGHASFRSTLKIMRDLFGVSISLGTIHTVLRQAAQRAIAINACVDLSLIRVGLHDELFQGSQPVLAGIDVASTYCYLLAPEAHRDGETWAIHLLDQQAQGLDSILSTRLPTLAAVYARVRELPGPIRCVTATCSTLSSTASRCRRSGRAVREVCIPHRKPEK